MQITTYLSHLLFHDGDKEIMRLNGVCYDNISIECDDTVRERLFFTKNNFKHKNYICVYVPQGAFFQLPVYKPMYGGMGTLVYDTTKVMMWGNIYTDEKFKETILTAFGTYVYEQYNKLQLINSTFTLQQVADLCKHNLLI